MKNALTIGCGQGASSVIIDTLLEKNYSVTNIGSRGHPGCNNIQIQWNDLSITNLHKVYKCHDTLDFVFFNQNGSSLEIGAFDPAKHDTLETWKLIKDWQQTYWISCQMPFLLLHHLKENLQPTSKVGWMLSSTMQWDQANVEQYPDYSSQKYFNFLAMKCFGRYYQTFGIMPNFGQSNSQELTKKIMSEICDNPVNCSLFKFSSYCD
jgi:hypothetical protein